MREEHLCNIKDDLGRSINEMLWMTATSSYSTSQIKIQLNFKRKNMSRSSLFALFIYILNSSGAV